MASVYYHWCYFFFLNVVLVFQCFSITLLSSFPSSDVSHQREDAEEPSITAYLHSHDKPNEFNCTDMKRITLSMTRGQDLDHRKYTFFLSPE